MRVTLQLDGLGSMALLSCSVLQHLRSKALLQLPSSTSRRPVLECTSAALLPMPNRVGMQPMPQVHLVDMRDELKEGNRSMFSRQLHEALLHRLERGEQSVLLLNRRGYSTFVMCRSCGYTRHVLIAIFL